MKLIIKKSYLLDTPCSEYDNLPNDEFDAIKEIASRGNRTEHISWLIANCKLAQTPKMLAYFKSLSPLTEDVCWLITNCKFAQTAKMLEYYKSYNSSAKNIYFLMKYCRFARTTKMLEYYKSLNTSKKDVSWLMNHYKFTSKRRHNETNNKKE